MCFFSIPYYTICYGLRTGLGVVLFGLGIFFVHKRSKYIGSLFILLSILTHFVFIIYAIVLLVSILKKKSIKLKYILLFSFISYLCSYYLHFLYGYNDVIDMLLGFYIAGQWGDEYEWNFNTFRFIFIESILPLGFMYFVYFKNRLNIKYDNFIRIGFMMIFLFAPFYTLFERHMVVMIMILGIYFLLNMSNNKLYSKSEIVLINVFLIASFLLPFRVYRNQYRVSNFKEIVSSSLFHVLNNTYTEREIYLHTDLLGDFEP